MKNLYFNGHYIVRGYKIFGTIYGKIVSSDNRILTPVGTKIRIESLTFNKISESDLKTLKDFGFVDSDLETSYGKEVFNR